MPARLEISMVVNLVGPTETGLRVHELDFSEFNRPLINHILPYAKATTRNRRIASVRLYDAGS